MNLNTSFNSVLKYNEGVQLASFCYYNHRWYCYCYFFQGNNNPEIYFSISISVPLISILVGKTINTLNHSLFIYTMIIGWLKHLVNHLGDKQLILFSANGCETHLWSTLSFIPLLSQKQNWEKERQQDGDQRESFHALIN